MGVAYLLAKGTMRKLLPSGFDGAVLVICAFILGIAVPVLVYTNLNLDFRLQCLRTYLAMGAIDAGMDRFAGQGYGQAAFYVVRNFYTPYIDYSWSFSTSIRVTALANCLHYSRGMRAVSVNSAL